MVTVVARIRERATGDRDRPDARHDEITVEAVGYEDARQLIWDRLPAGWLVASWRVER